MKTFLLLFLLPILVYAEERSRSLLPYQLRVLGFVQAVEDRNGVLVGDFTLVESNPDGKGTNLQIARWLSNKARPTQSELDAVKDAAIVLEAKEVAEAKQNAAVIAAVKEDPQSAKNALKNDANWSAKIASIEAANPIPK